MNVDAIVLAGGLGTRLRGVLPHLPKAMAPVGGRPFLDYVLHWLRGQGVPRVVLATGHMRQAITDHVGQSWGGMPVRYSEEQSPLGTGGAVRLALEHCTSGTVIVLNGDTWFPVNLPALLAFHQQSEAGVTLAAARVPDVSRYGALEVDDAGRVLAFAEKGRQGAGVINGGVYALRRELLRDWAPGEVFSLERDLLLPAATRSLVRAWPSDAPFLDIGVPEDLARAEHILPQNKEIR